MEKKKIGISIGDVNGVGLEVILKTLANPNILNLCTPIIYGSFKVVSYHKNVVGIEDMHFQSINSGQKPYIGKINVVNCWTENVNITIGAPSEEGAKYAIKSLAAATQELKEGYIDTYRHFYPEQEEVYSWWSMRSGARPRNVGWRLDYFITSPDMVDSLTEATIHTDIMGSDHCPVSITLK